MGRRVITQDVYQKLVEAFRSAPANAKRAAEAALVDWRTARRAWEMGFPKSADPAVKRPIKDVIAEEQLELRARMVREKDRADTLAAELEAKRRAETRALAVKDATETGKQELQLTRLARGATVQTLATITNIATGAAKIGAQVRQALDAMASQVDPATGQPRLLTPAEAKAAMGILQTLSGCLKQANDAGRTAMEMERVLAGEPTQITAHVLVGPMSVAEAEERIGRAQRALERAKRNGIVVEGGQLSPETPSNVVPLPKKAG